MARLKSTQFHRLPYSLILLHGLKTIEYNTASDLSCIRRRARDGCRNSNFGWNQCSLFQCLWRLVRGKPLRVLVIDKLRVLCASPWNLFQLRIIRLAPLESIIGWSCILIPVALIFPPGAVSVLSSARVDMQMRAIPTLNICFLVNDTFEDYLRFSFFAADSDTIYL
jgi:hypothetical protein